jgi:glycosyltransferase involved in cell wall biosynthesis
MDKVSVIISTYNRFIYLMNCIKSIQNQTYKNIEIIVVNDCSTDKQYYDYDWNDIKIIHLTKNSKNIFGYVSCGYVRNQGIAIATGKYIAFCDDDDIWFPNKIDLQLDAIKTTNCKMSSTEGLIGHGVYDPTKIYSKYNSEANYTGLYNKYKSMGSTLLENGFPKIWTLEFLKIHNCIIGSSALIEKSLLNQINNIKNLPCGMEDYDCWLRALEHTNSVYVQEVCFYYDCGHGHGQDY